MMTTRWFDVSEAAVASMASNYWHSSPSLWSVRPSGFYCVVSIDGTKSFINCTLYSLVNHKFFVTLAIVMNRWPLQNLGARIAKKAISRLSPTPDAKLSFLFSISFQI